jgi:serine/threonine protein kinase
VKELTILAAFGDHPNLVKLYGYTTEPATIVMELVKLGSLNSLLYFNEDSEIEARLCDARIKKRIACGIAFGMRQLHSVGIIHGDLKPANILITDDFNAKITDFGLSRLKVKTTSVIGSHIRDDGENVVAGTAAYMAPELIGNSRPRSLQADDKMDVYSFGILLNEIIHEEEPYVRDYDKLKGRGPFAAVDHAKSGNRPYMNTKLVDGDLFIVITASWNTFPQDRPDFNFISGVLRKKGLVFPSLIEIPF